MAGLVCGWAAGWVLSRAGTFLCAFARAFAWAFAWVSACFFLCLFQPSIMHITSNNLANIVRQLGSKGKKGHIQRQRMHLHTLDPGKAVPFTFTWAQTVTDEALCSPVNITIPRLLSGFVYFWVLTDRVSGFWCRLQGR